MGAPVMLRNANDAYVSEAKPSANFSSTTKLYLSSTGASNTRYAWIYFGRPFPLDATILSAKLRIYSGGTGWSGSVTMTAKRATEKWSVNRVNYNNRPGVTGTGASLTKSGATDPTLWEFDVTTMMQTVADGGVWYGVRIETNTTETKWIYSANGRDEYRPTLEVTWSDRPEAPEDLRPDGGRATSLQKPTLRFDFTDVSGDTDLDAVNVQINSTDVWTSPTFDSGWVTTSVPELDLADTAYAGLSVGSTVFWRVRVRDGAGLVSGWSDSATFKRTSKSSLTLSNPAASPNNVVEDVTPPILWSFSGTQVHYQLIVTDPLAPSKWIWTSGKVTSTDQSVTLPKGVLTDTGATYRLMVRVWDNVAREYTPGDTAYVEVVRDFTYRYDATVDPVTSLTGAPWSNRPFIDLEWNRAVGAPDSFTITRDGRLVESGILPEDVLVSGVHYKFTDREARPRRDRTWKVMAVVNGKTSDNNPTVTTQVKSITTLLSEIDSDRQVFFFNQEVDAERAESSEIQYLLGNAPPVMVSQSVRGYEGTVSGVLISGQIAGLTAEEQLENLEYFRDRPGMVLRLSWIDKFMRVVIRNVSDQPIAYPDGEVQYLASFDFFEVDF